MRGRAAAIDVLMLTRYGSLGASSRVRELIYEPWLTARGLSVATQPLLPDSYLQRLYAGRGRSRFEVAAAYARRLAYLLGAVRPAVVWLEKELWPFLPSWVERLLLARVPYVVDIDDAVFHTYDEHRSVLVKRILGDKIDALFKRSALVTAGSAYLAKRAAAAGARWIEPVPTVVDLRDYGPSEPQQGGELTFGWIGSPSTQGHLGALAPVLAELANDAQSRLVSIGTRFPANLFERHEQQIWRRETEAAQIARFDIGIMPLPDEPFERGKCGYKLIQYMAAGVPVVASPVGANKDIVRHGENGFLAGTPAEWRAALTALKQDAGLRHRMGAAGRLMVERQYALQVTGPKIANWLADIANSGRVTEVAR
jgi:glycosyltransferase involved in cell wall biosynthesis